ncbi:chitin deacetylase 7-like [Panulirus ornatus]|uniref:chitin deacetylase 7-like n=1 Tax=Panulirus ornatus TaxID=150431 RepID=UPI003A8AC2E3
MFPRKMWTSEGSPLLLALVALLAITTPAFSAPAEVTQDKEEPEECKQDENCFLPDCLCGSVHHPGDIPLEQVPQFVVLSFDDAITKDNYDFYLRFKNIKNPNKCRITMTFFVSHLYTNYSMVNELHRLGHEIALHSVTHKSDVQNYWRPANESVWQREMDDVRDIIVENAKIPRNDLKGWRAPFLEVGGNEMFTALSEAGLTYDSSWPTLEYTNWHGANPKGALWPYTLDYPSIQDCQLGRCPSKKFKGQWVMPMVDLNDNTGEACAMLDTCRSLDDELLTNPDAVFYFLKRNFNINYLNNKAPYGLYVHHSWFYEGTLNNSDARMEGYTRFLEWLSVMDDVYVVSLDRVLEWVRNPVPLSEINTIDTFRCQVFDPETTCPDVDENTFTQANNLPYGLREVIMATCTRPKPEFYPWLYNPYGTEDIVPDS